MVRSPCDAGAAVGLFAQLGGTPDAGGSWTDPLGNAHSGSFDPSTDAAGVYTYTLAALAPCLGDQEHRHGHGDLHARCGYRWCDHRV
ncbi:MAG: hypothetical protein IPM68_18770 [Flavobacteriales bacterium]|nr:hypothetical protein [Flavobacteriales bacterium]